jgi:hypothetical protein
MAAGLAFAKTGVNVTRIERLLHVDLVQSCKGLPEPPI